MKKLLIAFTATMLMACGGEEKASYNVIPLPQSITLNQGEPFRLNRYTRITYPAGDNMLQRDAEFLAEYIARTTLYKLKVEPASECRAAVNVINLLPDSSIANPEGYRIETNASWMSIKGSTPAGIFYGIQTLRKAMPAEAERAEVLLPAGIVEDEPQFAYRGMHLDVSRHFFDTDFVKRYIDLLALHNMNTLHWHLTDDQGWRIEIKKYPKLTEVGAWRDKTVVGRAGTGKYDGKRYGGFYTKEELKDIVKYAADRHITVIPEVDMPGHMLAALASYPEFGCTGGPYEVCPDWGVFPDVLCVGNEKTMKFLEDVFEEVIEIFPSKYIHVGGDEIPRTRWEACPKCQARIKAEGLKADDKHSAEDRLQSYCTKRIEKFLNERGRQIIGWDEILEGDIAPNATVMSWRGSEGGIQAARMGHKVVMTPNTYCYFDYYQVSNTDGEPLAIGGCLPIEKVYEMNPTESLDSAQAKYIWGVQANLWTEYIGTTDYLEYMVLPRMAALAEVQWTKPGKKDFKNFTSRLVNLLDIYRRDGFNFGKHLYGVKADYVTDTSRKAVMATLSTIDNAPIHYTLDGSVPTKESALYTKPVAITQTADFRALAIRKQDIYNKVEARHIAFNKATLCPITLTTTQPAPNYTYAGPVTLVDGKTGNLNFNSGEWLGFVGKDVTALIDLGKTMRIHYAGVNAITDMASWIMAPSALQVYISMDNKNFKLAGNTKYLTNKNLEKRCIMKYDLEFSPVVCRYVKLVVVNTPALPKGHSGEGQIPFMFLDEIEID